MPFQLQHSHTYLFTVRVWVEPSSNEQLEVRMEVRHVLSGETRYFRQWTAVVAFLEGMLHTNSTGVPKGEESI